MSIYDLSQGISSSNTNLAETNLEQYRQMIADAAQQFPAQRPWETKLPPSATTTLSDRARELFLKRMGGIRAEMKMKSTDFVGCHVYMETVYLFYCFGGREGVTKESIDVFPSDTLIAQFRMILL